MKKIRINKIFGLACVLALAFAATSCKDKPTNTSTLGIAKVMCDASFQNILDHSHADSQADVADPHAVHIPRRLGNRAERNDIQRNLKDTAHHNVADNRRRRRPFRKLDGCYLPAYDTACRGIYDLAEQRYGINEQRRYQGIRGQKTSENIKYEKALRPHSCHHALHTCACAGQRRFGSI